MHIRTTHFYFFNFLARYHNKDACYYCLATDSCQHTTKIKGSSGILIFLNLFQDFWRAAVCAKAMALLFKGIIPYM